MLVDKWLYGEKKEGAELKEMKVKVPIEFHIKLHGLKLLKNQSISRSVELALAKYFKELEVLQGGHVPAAKVLEDAIVAKS